MERLGQLPRESIGPCWSCRLPVYRYEPTLGRLNIHDNGRCATLVSEDDEAVVYRLPSGGTIRLGKKTAHRPRCRCAPCRHAREPKPP